MVRSNNKQGEFSLFDMNFECVYGIIMKATKKLKQIYEKILNLNKSNVDIRGILSGH